MSFTEHLYQGYRNRKFDIDKRKTEDFIDRFFRFIFFLEYQRCSEIDLIEARLNGFKTEFQEILSSVMKGRETVESDYFFAKFPEIYQMLEEDARFIFENDPAAKNVEEVMFSYPGFFAIAVYRLSHELFKNNVPLIPRIWTEYAHSKTGIDIHPGAAIGKNFFIDHGTGIVIGETTVIGNNVKLYQGVTLGALSVTKDLANEKRHPTIEDHVVIYANATILGGETVIGAHSLIGGNVWITESVTPNSVVFHKGLVTVKNKLPVNEPINFII
ncbi:serine O-acetyltransferase EpsC [Kaistella faecalis]|uniref:serine O-acetyltransferase EpsC n=1 Tax=Kaistella faecalis TaxID=2852098 RepID=UPI001C456294|nr:serine O-acetyltransferase EpsC [Chryseobacterium faecale]UFK98509.1 serine O-acetyltransferase [Chryseobacterium faecale]